MEKTCLCCQKRFPAHPAVRHQQYCGDPGSDLAPYGGSCPGPHLSLHVGVLCGVAYA